jgi:predicted nucleic-acid-binding protein
MIGLDSNVLARYIAGDDASQSAAAARVIESLSAESPGFVPLVVIAELVWVLQYSYRLNKHEIAEVVEKLLRSAELMLENAEIVAQALREFHRSRADFADCLIERCAHAAGCQHTVTFDKRAASLAEMRLIQ